MKLNNKGFAITTVLYGLLILFVVLVSSYLLVLSVKKDRIEELTSDIEKEYRKDTQTLTGYITELYNNSKKNIVVYNNDSYRYNISESLMNDRLGGTVEEHDAGNIRYYGKKPNNYIYFNCSDYKNQTSSTCELWRIIGVFDDKVKIIKNDSIGNYIWNDKESSSWSTSNLQIYLNNDYYNVLNETTKKQITENVWNIGKAASLTETVNAYYKQERISGNVWIGKIGLMYLSDYGYATDFNRCKGIPVGFNTGECYNNDWLYLGKNEWTMVSYGTTTTIFISTSGASSYKSVTDNNYEVRPTLYLAKSVGIKTGTGTQSNPYQIKV